MLFLQLAMKQLKDGGRCGIVLDEGVLFRTNEQSLSKLKKNCSMKMICIALSAFRAVRSQPPARA